MEPLVCAIDIGNTNTRIGLVDCRQLTCIETDTFSSEYCVQKIPAGVKNLIVKHNIEYNPPVKISTVIRALRDDITATLAALPGIGSISFVSYREGMPLTIHYDNPGVLGSDRIANCLFCIKKYPQTDCIIIDAGTAITVDILSSKGAFEGGFIFPGYELQLHSLYYDTAELPQVENASGKYTFPPHSTQAGMAQGVYLALAGGITHIVNKIQNELHGYATIAACGGEWSRLKNLISFSHDYIPEITLIGTGLYEDT
jgi:type III pantothenate kinase